MKRRGFLGFMGGAAVAGPGMVKEAAAKTLADLSLGGIGGFPPSSPYPSGAINSLGQMEWASKELAKLGLRPAAQHAFHKRRTQVHSLDPDLASYRSIALHRKISIQRERQYERELRETKSYFEATVAGWFD